VKLPIPLTILTGFLGSGKTTLLKAVLASPVMAGTAVIVNEFGEVGLDDALIRSTGGASDDNTVLLPSGCVCCEVQGDLVEALLKLHEDVLAGKIPEIIRVVLETTGLADPGPIARALISDHDLFRVYRLDGIVTTVDAEHIRFQLAESSEPARQIALADRLVLTKTDRVVSAIIDDAERLMGELNVAASITRVVKGAVDPALLFGIGATEIGATGTNAEAWLGADKYKAPVDHAHDHDCSAHGCEHAHNNSQDHMPAPAHDAHIHLHGISSFCLIFEKPLDGRKLEGVMEAVRMVYGAKILRMKGIIAVEGEALPFVVHGVSQTFYPTEQLPAWPSDDHRSRIVFITRHLDEKSIRTAFAPLLGDT
jgi:G3E family GTPase